MNYYKISNFLYNYIQDLQQTKLIMFNMKNFSIFYNF